MARKPKKSAQSILYMLVGRHRIRQAAKALVKVPSPEVFHLRFQNDGPLREQ